jgi:hypothetical protein
LALFDFVKSIKEDAEQEKRIGDSQWRFDIVVPSAKLAIEFNGTYWHSAARGKPRGYHIEKRKLAEGCGYRLISIWENDYEADPERINELVASALGHTKATAIPGRKLKVVEIDFATAVDFHKRFHLQKTTPNGNQHFALEHDGKIMACATFKTTQNTSELTRYTVMNGYSLIGGLSKLISRIDAKQIVTFADRDYFTGNMYQKAGFTYAGTSLQLTYWEKKTNKRHRRERFMKHKLAYLGIEVRDEDTERTALERAGVFQCWNSGIDKWVFSRQ